MQKQWVLFCTEYNFGFEMKERGTNILFFIFFFSIFRCDLFFLSVIEIAIFFFFRGKKSVCFLLLNFKERKNIYLLMLRRSSIFTPTSIALMFPGEAVRRRVNIESQNSRPNDFDIDKEQWGKQMKFASLECVIDNNIQPYTFWSLQGIRRNISGWMTMKKLTERRPTFKNADLSDLFLRYKVICNGLDQEKLRQLSRFTTFSEAERLSKEALAELHARMKTSSWKTIASAASKTARHKQQLQQQQQQAKNKDSSSTTTASNTTSSEEGKSSDKKSNSSSSVDAPTVIASGIAGPNMAGVEPYEIHIDKFEVVNLWMGSMTAEDWIQVTARCEFREKNASVGPLANKLSLSQGSSSAAAEALRLKSLHGGATPDKDGFVKVIEYPVFEVKLGDGITAANTQPFSIVAILDKDGSRYGKDGNDVSLLRKNFAATGKSRWGFNR
jgi:hypothetical protein